MTDARYILTVTCVQKRRPDRQVHQADITDLDLSTPEGRFDMNEPVHQAVRDDIIKRASQADEDAASGVPDSDDLLSGLLSPPV